MSEVRDVLISNVCAATGLTKKAVEYYAEQGFIGPGVLENGYRDFSAGDIETLKRIAVLRKLGLGIEDIRSALGDAGEALQKLSVCGRLKVQKENAKQALLDKLSIGRDWDGIAAEVASVEKNMTIAEKLLGAFPGYYGRFVSLHFAYFLDMQIETSAQQEAYETIVRFLDNAPAMEFPEDVKDFLAEYTADISVQDIEGISENMRQSIDDPQTFLSEHKDMLKRYSEYKQSEEYKRSPAYKFETLLRQFGETSSYYDVFIPAMKTLSPAYAEYHNKLEAADKLLNGQIK